MWSSFRDSWNGVSLFLDDHMTLATDIQLFTDSTDKAHGGFYNNMWFQGQFPDILLQEDTSMALFELYPIVMACALWGHNWTRRRILMNCENESVVYIINKGRSKIPSIMKLVRRMTYLSATPNFTIQARHLRSEENCIADAISCYQIWHHFLTRNLWHVYQPKLY